MSSPKSPPKPDPTLITYPFPTSRLYPAADKEALEEGKAQFMNLFRLKTLGEMKRILSFIRKLTKAVITMTRTFDVYPPGTRLEWNNKDRNTSQITTVSYTRSSVKSAQKSLNEAITNIYYYFRKRGSKNTVKGESLRKFQGTYARMYVLPGPALAWIQNEYFGDTFWNVVTQASGVPNKEATLLWNGFCLGNTYTTILYIAANANNLKFANPELQPDGKSRNISYVRSSQAMVQTFGNPKFPCPIYSATYSEEGMVTSKYKGPPLNDDQKAMTLYDVIRQDSYNVDKQSGEIISYQRFNPAQENSFSFHLYWFLKIKSLSGVSTKDLRTFQYLGVNGQEVINTFEGKDERITLEHNAVKGYNDAWNESLKSKRDLEKKNSKTSRISIV